MRHFFTRTAEVFPKLGNAENAACVFLFGVRMQTTLLKRPSAARSNLMRQVHGKDTLPERAVRSQLHRIGVRFRLHQRSLPGTPDLCLRKYGTVIFVHGCFWHRHAGCRRATTPKSNSQFWQSKFRDNRRRDRRIQKKLREGGWRVLVVWECETKDKEPLRKRLAMELGVDA